MTCRANAVWSTGSTSRPKGQQDRSDCRFPELQHDRRATLSFNQSLISQLKFSKATLVQKLVTVGGLVQSENFPGRALVFQISLCCASTPVRTENSSSTHGSSRIAAPAGSTVAARKFRNQSLSCCNRNTTCEHLLFELSRFSPNQARYRPKRTFNLG